ncbi:hypothetical protein GCM10010862_12630 [Devosia nitrariae]|uniref:Uncharacterized protein n=2 Tax=Devosia nitrariae TaxID=2071872 RepID=A0ABQ5W2A0_9HYPH|nr:hypothetical protein GCM10010862_12630 [Devosia nitrariae]
MAFPSARAIRAWIATIAVLWPLPALGHPHVASEVGAKSYLLATAITAMLLLAVLLLPRMLRLLRLLGRLR